MSSVYLHRYAGPVRALVTDLAGTVVDHGSSAPAGAFVELFRRRGVAVTQAQAREPMGLEKKDHIRVLAAMPAVAAQWEEAHGRAACSEDDIEALYQTFIPLQLDVLPRYSALIPGVREAVDALRERGVRIAANTGYNRRMMESVLQATAGQGFVPDAAVCASDVAGGRPAPWMIFRSLEMLGVYPPEAAVKIGDTVPDIEDGLNAGVWTIGVTRTGNMLGLSETEVEALAPDERGSRLASARRRLLQAGAHFVVESFADCVAVVEEIDQRLLRHERP